MSALIERAHYHGIPGLLVGREAGTEGWPIEVLDALKNQALGLAMWEMRHKAVLTRLLDSLAQQGILAIILKGTALAYDLYEIPATRMRGDTDLLVARSDLPRTRQMFQELGFCLHPQCEGGADEHALQEVWEFEAADATTHSIDLHWQAVNSLALADALTFADCAQELLELPRLCASAHGMDRKRALIFACMHRAAHITSPYIVDGVTYYGGDRLIWAWDIHLLAGALPESDWDGLCSEALAKGLGAVCLDGLSFARLRLGTSIPANVIAKLAAAPADERASAYLLGSGQASRALSDLGAVPGLLAKARFAFRRLLPPGSFMRAKYPHMHDRALVVLYLRRMAELLRNRPERSDR